MTNEALAGHGNWRELPKKTFAEVVERLPEALKKEGFGIITQIDMQETLKAKIGVDFRRYRIFGACNPTFAHAALGHDLRVGVLLPCNVVVYENEGHAVVGAVNPVETLGAAGAAPLQEIAREIDARLLRVLDAIAN